MHQIQRNSIVCSWRELRGFHGNGYFSSNWLWWCDVRVAPADTIWDFQIILLRSSPSSDLPTLAFLCLGSVPKVSLRQFQALGDEHNAQLIPSFFLHFYTQLRQTGVKVWPFEVSWCTLLLHTECPRVRCVYQHWLHLLPRRRAGSLCCCRD